MPGGASRRTHDDSPPRRFASIGGRQPDRQAVSALYRRLAGRPGTRAAMEPDPLFDERLVMSGPDAAGLDLAEAGLSPALAPEAPPAAARSSCGERDAG